MLFIKNKFKKIKKYYFNKFQKKYILKNNLIPIQNKTEWKWWKFLGAIGAQHLLFPHCKVVGAVPPSLLPHIRDVEWEVRRIIGFDWTEQARKVVVGDEAVGGLISLLLNNNAISTCIAIKTASPLNTAFISCQTHLQSFRKLKKKNLTLFLHDTKMTVIIMPLNPTYPSGSMKLCLNLISAEEFKKGIYYHWPEDHVLV